MTTSSNLLRLPSLFTEHMVVRSDVPNPLWGWAPAGAQVTVHFQDKAQTVSADANGRWRAELPAAAPGGPYALEITSGTERIRFTDVLAGEVWLCSGQSNMQWSVAQSDHAEKETASANYPGIRFFKVPCVARKDVQENIDAQWEVCTPQTVGGFSGVGYFFGRDLHQHHQVPLGLIGSSWGGTTAEAWTEWSFLQDDPAFADFVNPYVSMLKANTLESQRDALISERWQKAQRHKDPGNRAFFFGWADPGIDETEWKDYQAPALWQTRGMPHNGAVWFRKNVVIPAEWAGRDLTISLGALDDYDETFFNGMPVGATGNETPNWWASPRYYKIPASLVKAGQENLIAVRIFDDFGQGGFAGGSMGIYPEGESLQSGIRLEGTWKCRVELALDATVPPKIQNLAAPFNSPQAPSNLYNAMIAPLTPFGLTGTIWYQGESNVARAEQYRKLFPTMIQSWRKSFAQPDIAFLFVLLANYNALQADPVEGGGWAELREAQLEALKLPRTGFASAIDVGLGHDIHPTDKQSVGHRLALTARTLLHGEKIESSGPVFQEAKREGKQSRLFFTHANGLKTRDDQPLTGFAVRGPDGPWSWAQAEIQKDSIVLWNGEVPHIEHIRYGWANNPTANLCNAEGLPATPFRTDML